MSQAGATPDVAATDRWDTLARAAARGTGVDEEDLALRQLLTFQIDGAPYAVPVERVSEIVRIRPITPIPRMPEDVRGVISLRGKIVQVVDLRRRLGVEAIDPTRSSRIIVVHDADGQVAGLLVDAVTEVLRVPPDSIRPSPFTEFGAVEALCPRGEEFVSLIDLTRVLEIDAGR
jgi:purine-binding chemotaxis protein CheW